MPSDLAARSPSESIGVAIVDLYLPPIYKTNKFSIMNNAFSDNMKLLRKQMGMSQVRFAEFLAVKSSRIGAWEEGRCLPVPTMLIQIAERCKIFDIPAFLSDSNYFVHRTKVAEKINLSEVQIRYKKLTDKDRKVVDLILGLS
jgi:transcriptional regulator with XRE-family HTH domain